MGNKLAAGASSLDNGDYLNLSHEIYSLADSQYQNRFKCFKYNRKPGMLKGESNLTLRVFDLRGGRLSYSIADKKSRTPADSGSEAVKGTMNLAEATVKAGEVKSEEQHIEWTIDIIAGLENEKDLKLQLDATSDQRNRDEIMRIINLHITLATIKRRCEALIRTSEMHAAGKCSFDTVRDMLVKARDVESMAANEASVVNLSPKNGGGVYPALEHLRHCRAIIMLEHLENTGVDPFVEDFSRVRNDFLLAMESSSRRQLNEHCFLYRNVEGLTRVFSLRAERARELGRSEQMLTLYRDLLKIYQGALQETLKREGVSMYASMLAENIGRVHWNGEGAMSRALQAVNLARDYAQKAADAGKLRHPMVSYASANERLTELQELAKQMSLSGGDASAV